MDKLIFSQTGVYRLQQLANQVHQHCNVRYKLSKQAGIIDLLRYSSKSEHRVVMAYYVAFTNSLNSLQRDQLNKSGISVGLPHTQKAESRQNYFSLTG